MIPLPKPPECWSYGVCYHCHSQLSSLPMFHGLIIWRWTCQFLLLLYCQVVTWCDMLHLCSQLIRIFNSFWFLFFMLLWMFCKDLYFPLFWVVYSVYSVFNTLRTWHNLFYELVLLYVQFYFKLPCCKFLFSYILNINWNE